MDILREVMKRLLVTAIKEKDEACRDILRLVIADVESDCKRQDDDKWAESVIRKHLKQIDESLHFFAEDQPGHSKLTFQKSFLNSLLPKTLTEQEIEAELLNSSGREVEDIQEAKSEGQATGIAMKFFRQNNLNVLGKDVKSVVSKIRF